ncbi:MAG: RHS repeat-associated core domain-containing protein [Anaerolineae bacterium]
MDAPPLGRWIAPDTVVPDPADPQSLNRYAYVLGNPLALVDPDGHEPITGCNGIPDCDVDGWRGFGHWQAQQDIQAERDKDALEIAATFVVVLTLGPALPSIASNIAPMAPPLCADGDCTNETQAVIRGSQNAIQTVQSVWKLDPLKRGQEIERMLGRSPQLSQNFPVIDRFENGVATSIKSIDLGARSYQSIGRLTSTVRGYVNELANWQGVRQWGGVSIDKGMITARELQLAIPQGATDAQLLALRQLQQWASTIGVTISWAAIP